MISQSQQYIEMNSNNLTPNEEYWAFVAGIVIGVLQLLVILTCLMFCLRSESWPVARDVGTQTDLKDADINNKRSFLTIVNLNPCDEGTVIILF